MHPQQIHPHIINERFVQYYQKQGFKRLPDTPLLHPSIPMTFVMSAGLAQVETAIDQLESRSPGNDYVLVQNCFRHFDVDKIGRSNMHLSLFQMPGAFSFGQKSKQAAIQRTWNFLIYDLKIDPQRLWATYFRGGGVLGHSFEQDHISCQTWQKMGLPKERIIGLGADHNFWKQGGGIDGQETNRKCGPNTELFFDRGVQFKCGPNCCPGCKCGRFVEFANSLFIFAEINVETGDRDFMANPFTETVIGTERVAMILADRPAVFDIDTVKPLIKALRTFYPQRHQATPFNIKASERVLIDHLRALVFLAADGAPPPGKGGRRRLMRILIRRMLTQKQLLQINSPQCLPSLINLLITLHGDKQPDTSTALNTGLERGRDRLLNYIETESPTFEHTLARGYRQFDRLLAAGNGTGLQGEQLVSLVKQFGMPLALLQATLAEKGIEFIADSYSKAIEQWKYNLHASSAAGC